VKKIAVFGICGKMGVSITKELLKEKDFKVVCGLDIVNSGEDFGQLFIGKKLDIVIYSDYNEVKKLNPDVILDFTIADAAYKSILWSIENEIDIIVGTTGISKERINEISLALKNKKSKVFIVPNFSIGAVVMMKISKLIAGYFDNCEIIELHHEKKKDAPSGTALITSEFIAQQKKFDSFRLKEGEAESVEGSRGAFYNGLHIHSVRLPGFLASQEVIFGTIGQRLTIRHDSIDRLSFYPGVLLALKKIDTLPKFTIGLDKVIEI